ncbi:MAG: alkaline phosphatase [Solirubrobacteraceae bacterium]|jgi:phosphodiesterase/alkaline phosphatase D-like protein|nr:alkaline phosphatase [Solirubrobacteraceae bacterium]
MRRTTRRELIVAAGATALTASVPPAWGRLTSRRTSVGPGRFFDGVASGEPSATAVTFWSRIRTDHPRSGARLIVAADAGLDDVVATTVVPTGRGVNGTVKARVGGLDPHTEYFYAWQTSGSTSPVGRTRTAPPKTSRTPVRVAYSSCQHYNYGYFSPHQHAAGEDLDLYVFLGDYIYERGRVPSGAVRTDRIDAVDLDTYRRKYAIYRRDPGLRELHRQHPIVHIWDDHEVFNNYSQNNPPPSESQRWAGYRAAFEWMPRMVFPRDRFRIYKKLSLGAYVDVFLLDTRQYRTGFGDGNGKAIMSTEEMAWLVRGLKASKARWKVVANQVVITADPFGTGESSDQWDGFPASRAQLLGAIENAGLRDVIFITGDAHVFLCSLLGTDFAAAANDPNRVPAGVEYVGGAVTSPGQQRPEAEAHADAPWIQEYNGRDKGYALFAADANQLVTEYRKSDLTSSSGATVAFDRFTQPAGTNRVTRESLAPPT